MLAALVVALRSLALICGGHRAVALENLALRQQLAVFKRTVRRPPLRHRDRLFWLLLANAWRDWRTALIVVDPDTSYVGIAIGSAANGRGAQRRAVLVARVRLQPFGHS
jgi:hypothetical protein